MWLIYQILFGVFLLVIGPILLLTRGSHYRPTIASRFGLHYPKDASKGALWIHAVSVGEVSVAHAFLRDLDASLPILITTITPTGQKRAQKLFENRAQITYLPYDLGFAVKRFFRAYEPRALVLVEGDYWPLLLHHARKRGLPIAVINGRIGDRSFQRLRRIRTLTSGFFAPIQRFGLQSNLDEARLVQLGVASDRIEVTGNLKFEAPEPRAIPELKSLVHRWARDRPVLVAGSTMPGEESLVLDAWRRVNATHPSFLILAPRHPERWPEVAELLEQSGLSFCRRSESPDSQSIDVLLLDSLGELASLYRFADGAFVGGTLVPTGGHNPLEPARFGKPVMVGPSMTNFRDMAAQFQNHQAWEQVENVEEMAEVWRRWLAEPDQARVLGLRGQKLVESNRGALQQTYDWVCPLWEQH